MNIAPDLARRVALVTGASRGLGAEIARTLARAGFAVAVNGRTPSPEADREVHDMHAAGGVEQPGKQGHQRGLAGAG